MAWKRCGYSVSDTAEHGGYEGGDRLVTAETKREMGRMLEDIQAGRYAKRWVEEYNGGSVELHRRRDQEGQHPIETVGRNLRSMIAFLEGPNTAASETAKEAPQPVGSVS